MSGLESTEAGSAIIEVKGKHSMKVISVDGEPYAFTRSKTLKFKQYSKTYDKERNLTILKIMFPDDSPHKVELTYDVKRILDVDRYTQVVIS